MACAIPANPVEVPGLGPSANTYSISGSAHSAELKSPRSLAAKIERTRSRFSDIAYLRSFESRSAVAPALSMSGPVIVRARARPISRGGKSRRSGADNVVVLLRHRLLLQASGLESVG